MSTIDEPILATSEAPGFWRRLIRQRPSAFVALIFLTLLYASLPFAELIAPYSPDTRSNDALFAPPQTLHLFHDGALVGPYVYGYTSTVDLDTYQRKFTLDELWRYATSGRVANVMRPYLEAVE